MRLYHGTNVAFDAIDLTKSKPYKDFGRGFYLSPNYEQAMELIKENAEVWHLDAERIAAIGFSAGGHLCACAATIAKNKPAAAILVYSDFKGYLRYVPAGNALSP